MLTRDLRARPLPAPVLYPGSIERTSVAEAGEAKGYLIVEIAANDGAASMDWRFVPLPARPLVRHDLQVDGLDAGQVEANVRSLVAGAPVDAVLSIRVAGDVDRSVARVLSGAFLRAIAPTTINVEIRLADRMSGVTRSGVRLGRTDELELPL